MFDKRTLNKSKSLEQQWQEECSKRYGEREAKLVTSSGIPVKPVYTPADIEDTDYKAIGMPGQYPYTRGIYPLQYQVQPWMMQLGFGYGLPEQSRTRKDYLDKEEMEGYAKFGWLPPANLVADLPGQSGYDPDHPVARGRVGVGGMSISTTEELARALDGFPLDKVSISFNWRESSLAMLSMYVVYAERRGFPPQVLHGNSPNLLYRHGGRDLPTFPPNNAMKLIVELIKHCTQNMPRWNTLDLDEYGMYEVEGNAIQGIAFPSAVGIAIAEECIKAGLDLDDFLPRWSFHMAQGNDFFEEIAKHRAMRRMWAKITKERFGCKNDKALLFRTYTQTAGSTLTAQQPLNNIVRIVLQALGAVLSGSNAIWTTCYDEALALPTEESVRLALRTQQILLHETNITNVSDPLAGSYYLEWLTNRLEEEATKLIERIDDMGYIKAWETGWIRKELERTAYEKAQRIDKGEDIIVGVNKYKIDEEQRVSLFKHDPKAEEIAIERVRRFREERDNTRTEDTLAKLRQVAQRVNVEWPRGGDLMPVVKSMLLEPMPPLER